MQTSEDIGQMMQAFAQEAVRLAREFKIELDYSEASLQQVEILLSRLHDELQNWTLGKSSPDLQPNEKQIDQMSKIWGGYLGEVVRRRFGGEWTIEKYPSGNFLIVTLNVNGAKVFPSMKIHKRLTNGSSENIWSFYQTMYEKLASKPGTRIQ